MAEWPCIRAVVLTDEEPSVGLPVELLPGELAEHPPGRDDIKQSDDDASVLSLQIPHGVRRIGEERLSGHDLDARLRAPCLQILHGRDEHLLGLLQDGDPRPPELPHQLDTRRVVDRGRGVGAEQRWEAVTVREGGGAGAVAQLKIFGVERLECGFGGALYYVFSTRLRRINCYERII